MITLIYSTIRGCNLIFVIMKNDQLCRLGLLCRPSLCSLTVQTFQSAKPQGFLFNSWHYSLFIQCLFPWLPSFALSLYQISNIERGRKKEKKKLFLLIESRPQFCSPWLNTGLCHPHSHTLADQNYTDCHVLPRWQIGDRHWGSRGTSGLVELWELKFTLNT